MHEFKEKIRKIFNNTNDWYTGVFKLGIWLSSLIDGNRRDFNTEDILAAVSETVPLAAIAKEQITSLKRWAAEAGARTASIDTLLIEELKVYSQQQGLGPLEVD